MLLGQSLAALRLLLALGLNQALLEVAIVAVLEALRDVHKGRSVKEWTQGLQVVLLHVSHAEVAVARYLAERAILVLGGTCLAAEQSHQGGLAATIAPADGHTRVQAKFQVAVLDQVVLVAGEAEGEVLGLQDCPRARLHALHGARNREAELWRPRDGWRGLRCRTVAALLFLLVRLLGVEGEVARKHRVDLLLREALLRRESGEVARRVLELLVHISHDICADLVEELGLVADDHDRRVRDGVDVVAEPLDGLLIQVICRLVEQHQVRMLQHGNSQGQAHPPARRQICYGLVEHLLWEAYRKQRVPACVVNANVLRHLDAIFQRTEAALAHEPELGIVHMNALEVFRHADDAMVCDLFHQRGLARTVLTHDAVAVVLLHLERGALEEEMPCPVHEQQVLHIQEHLVVTGSGPTLRIKGLAQHRPSHSLGHCWQLLLKCSGCITTMHFNERLQCFSDRRSDLRAGKLLLPTFENGRRCNGAAVGLHIPRKRREGRVRPKVVLCIAALPTCLPCELCVGRLAKGLASDDIRGSAAWHTV
mmetsp:Transcript_109467/g.274188  ORF Transcript_109467/g.274188 Transcript_109467/m.274188 type:complete len:538 (+) Transcript_109467:865-2478(+)